MEPAGEPEKSPIRSLWPDTVGAPNLVNEIGTARRPDFLCIGTEKAGTTWLWNCMKSHPNIGVPATKELRMFNERRTFDPNHFRAAQAFFENPRGVPLRPDFLERVATELRLLYGGIPAYLRVFGQLNEPVVGELTPQYCIQPPEQVQKMRNVAPDARIVYMLRDPVERLISGARMVLKSSQTPPDDKLLLREAMHPMQLRFCNSHIHIDKFGKVFGEDRLGVFFYDDISRQPAGLLQDICDFVGAERAAVGPKILSEKVNQGSSYQPDRDVYTKLYAKLLPVYKELEQLFPKRVRVWRDKYE